MGQRIKRIQIGKEVVKLSPFAVDMILCQKALKPPPKKTLRSHKHIHQRNRIKK
jgi:hypothetical protein